MQNNHSKAIFYDFDGVLKESHTVKTTAIHQLFLPFGEEIAEKATEYHLEHGGISRVEKIKYAYKHWIKQPLSNEQLRLHANQFSKLVYKAVIDAPFVEGALNTIEYFYKKIPQYIITGTPEHEIMEITNELNINKYFTKICGSPTSKNTHIQKLIKQNNLHIDKIVFIGDALTDYHAASDHNLHFILRTHPENTTFFKDYNGYKMSDLKPAIQTIEKILSL